MTQRYDVHNITHLPSAGPPRIITVRRIPVRPGGLVQLPADLVQRELRGVSGLAVVRAGDSLPKKLRLESERFHKQPMHVRPPSDPIVDDLPAPLPPPLLVPEPAPVVEEDKGKKAKKGKRF